MNENSLRNVIVKLIECLKEEQAYASTLGNEIAALRNALDELSREKFLPLLEKHRSRLRETTAALAADDSARYDDLIRRVKAGDAF